MIEEQQPQPNVQYSELAETNNIAVDLISGAKSTPSLHNNKPSCTFWGYAVVFYVVALTLMAFVPEVSGILFPVELAAGVAVGINFLIRMSKFGSSMSLILRIFFILVGIGGGIFLFFASAMAGIVAYYTAHPLHGD